MEVIDEAALHEARSKLLDRVAKFFGLKRTGVAYTTKVIGLMNPPSSVRAPINLALPWHKSVTEVA